MKIANYILDRSVFVFTWLTISTVSISLATLFAQGMKNILGV